MTATEISTAQKPLRSRPVFVQGIMQKTLHELVAPCDAEVNGVLLRLPVGCVVCLIGGGSGGAVGSLMTPVDFRGRDGETYRATQGMSLRIPA